MKTVYSFLEKLLKPWELWASITAFCGILLILPNNWIATLGIESLLTTYKPYISLVFLAALVVAAIRVVCSILKAIRHREKINTTDLAWEEEAILYGYILNEYQSIELLRIHRIVARLRNRGFLRTSSYVITSDDFERHYLTTKGEKFLKSKKFKNKLPSTDQELIRAVSLLNSLSRRQIQLVPAQTQLVR